MDQNLVTDDTKKMLSDTPSLENLTPDQKQQLDELIEVLLKRVFTRVASVLTDQDIDKIDELDQQADGGQAVKDYLTSKVPNFDALIEEEASNLKKEAQV